MEKGRTKKSIINIGFNLANQIVTIALSFISRTVFIYTLGVEYLGINGLFTDVLGILSMADLGFNTAMVYSFYRPLAENDIKKLAALTTFYRRVYNIIAIAITIIGLLITPFLDFIVKIENEIPLLKVYYLFSLMGIVISYLFVYKTSIITADQKNYVITRISIIFSLIQTVTQIIVLLVFHSYLVYLGLGIVIKFLNNFVASKKAEKLYTFIKEKQELDKKSIGEIIVNLKSVFIYKVSSVLLNATDNIIISSLLGTVLVGYYSNYLMLNNKIIAIFSLLFTSLTASIGNLIVKDSPQKRYEIFECEQSISFICCCIIIPCYANLVNDLIYIWLGIEYQMDISVVIVIALNLYLSCVMQPLWSYREATGLYQKTKWIMLVAAIINIILSVILGIIMGIKGVLLASVIARILTYVWYEPQLLFGEYFDKKANCYFVSLVKNFLFVFCIIYILFYFSRFFYVDSWFMFFLKAIIYIVITFLLSLLLYRKENGFKILVSKVEQLRKK